MTAAAATIPGRKRGAGSNADALLGMLLVAPIVLVMAALVFFPLADTFWDSLHRVNPMQPGTPFIGLANYTNMLTDNEANRWHDLKLSVAKRANLTRHRASSDARLLQMTLVAMRERHQAVA